MLRNASPAGLGRALNGRRFGTPRRHGKLLVCPTDGPTPLLHFGMTGSLAWAGEDHRHDRLVLELNHGDLHYRNMRRLGGIWLARHDRDLSQIEKGLGPDWLDVSRSDFDELMSPRRGSIKATLMKPEGRRRTRQSDRRRVALAGEA